MSAESESGKLLPMADHDEIGRKVFSQPWDVQKAIVTIAAHCTAIRDQEPSQEVADLAACISHCCNELADALSRTSPASIGEPVTCNDPVHQFLADPTNHHNALTCSYCNPKGLKFAEPTGEPVAWRWKVHGVWQYAGGFPVSGADPLYASPIVEGQEDAARASDVGSGETWRDDPSADERWNAGLDYGMVQLCAVLGVDPKDVRWDAATETLDGDVCAAICNVFRVKYGEDFDPAAPAPSPAGLNEMRLENERLRNALKALQRATTTGNMGSDVIWFDQIETLHDFCSRILSFSATDGSGAA